MSRLHRGDEWEATLDVHYTNAEKEIDLETEEHLLIRVISDDKGTVTYRVRRTLTKSKLNGAEAPVPADQEPESNWYTLPRATSALPRWPESDTSTGRLNKLFALRLGLASSPPYEADWYDIAAKGVPMGHWTLSFEQATTLGEASTDRWRATFEECNAPHPMDGSAMLYVDPDTGLVRLLEWDASSAPIKNGEDIAHLKLTYTVVRFSHGSG